MVELHDNGDITHDGDLVGVLEWQGNTLVDITIDEQHRNQGFATEAVRQFIDRIEQTDHECVETTTVVSSAMESVLRANGFEKKSNAGNALITHDNQWVKHL